MPKNILLLLLLLFCSGLTFAQQIAVSGYLKDGFTHLPIAAGTISNPETRKKVQTDANGFFKLLVAPGDLLYAFASQYRYDTLRYSLLFLDTITIYLYPLGIMEAVTIETGYSKYQLDSVEQRVEFEKARGHILNSIDGSSSKPYFGLTINLDRLFKKKYRNKRKDEESFQCLEENAYVRFRFSSQMVAFYTGLKGEDLLRFIQLYTPSYQWLREHQFKEQLLDYLGEKLTHFRNLSATTK